MCLDLAELEDGVTVLLLKNILTKRCYINRIFSYLYFLKNNTHTHTHLFPRHLLIPTTIKEGLLLRIPFHSSFTLFAFSFFFILFYIFLNKITIKSKTAFIVKFYCCLWCSFFFFLKRSTFEPLCGYWVK